MAARGRSFWGLLPFLVIGIALIVAGFLADPSALTSDDIPLKPFLFVVGSCFLLFFLVMMVVRSIAGAAKQRKIEDLLATGQQGEAVVVGLEDTGMRIGDDPRVRLLLEVRIEGYSPYQVEKTIVVPMIRLPQVQVGSTVEVLADPSEPDNPDKIGVSLK